MRGIIQSAEVTPFTACLEMRCLLSLKRIVPPKVVRSISGMNMANGSGAVSSNSTEVALGMSHTLRFNGGDLHAKAYPQEGVWFFLAHFAAAGMPSVPLWPKPPVTRTICCADCVPCLVVFCWGRCTGGRL